jgi:hypothetical protein
MPYTPGSLKRAVDTIAQEQDADIGKWNRDLSRTGIDGAGLSHVSVSGPSALDPSSTHIGDRAKQIFEGSPKEAIKGVFGAGLDAVSIATGTGFGLLTHDIGNAIVNSLQEAFAKKHHLALDEMERLMGGAASNFDKLQNLVDDLPRPGNDLRELMDKKRQCGNDVVDGINRELQHAKTPEERDKLQKLADDANTWKTSRDDRIKTEQPDISNLELKQSRLFKEANIQLGQLKEGSDLLWAAKSGSSNYLTHTTPQAGLFASGMRQFLLGTRARMSAALGAQAEASQ